LEGREEGKEGIFFLILSDLVDRTLMLLVWDERKVYRCSPWGILFGREAEG
jgi:hypothetical protein